MDPANVSMIIPKTVTVRDVMLSVFDIDRDYFFSDKCKVPDLDYSDNKGAEIKSKYCCEYVTIFLELCKNSDTVIIKTKPDYPLWIETDDFIFILAPRVDNE